MNAVPTGKAKWSNNMANSTTAIYTTRNPVAPAATACCCPACAGLACLDRTRYFAGQLLTDVDLNNEQSYWLAKSRLHNRYLHGWGVVCGMQVVCGECDGWVTVKTGYALDPCGNDIIVCQDYPFNLAQAIAACCAPAKTAATCSPLRYTPPPACIDMLQTWCVTIQYQEQQSRMVTPLQQANTTSSTGACACPTMPSSQSTSTSTSTAATAACQATRIVEGFQIGITPTPADTTTGMGPGTIFYEGVQCLETAATLVAQRPYPSTGIPQNVTYQQAYQAICNYSQTVQNALSEFMVTHCAWEDEFANITITPPTKDGSGDLKLLQLALDKIVAFVGAFSFDCLCMSWMPPCPDAPCDNRLILACVTMQGKKIVDICHFGGGRQQVVTFPALYYWLSNFGTDTAIGGFISNLQRICCLDLGERGIAGFSGSNELSTRSLAVDRLSNPAKVNQFTNFVFAQKAGAAIVNAASGTSNAADLRPLVSQPKDIVARSLVSNKIGVEDPSSAGAASPITWTDVSSDPAWNDDAVASSAQYAPAAFNIKQPLTVFTKGNLVVGFEVTSPTDLLNTKVASLQTQVAQLTDLVKTLQPQTGAVPPPSPPADNPPPSNKGANG
jgi:hypothetical protein